MSGRLPLFLAAFVAAAPSLAAARALSVWPRNAGEKIKPFDLNHPARYRNSVWDGAVIRLAAGRNETIGFQVMVQAPESDLTVTGLSVDFHVPALSRSAECFSEHNLLITHPTNDDEHGGWFWYKAASPADGTGWTPDALVPLTARPGRGGLPLAVKGGTQQGFWVGLGVPPGPE